MMRFRHLQGMNEECDNGQWCFIDIDCPTTAILEPSVAKSSSISSSGGGGGRRKKKKQQQQQMQLLNGDINDSDGSGSDGRSKVVNSSSNGNGVDKHIIGKSRRRGRTK